MYQTKIDGQDLNLSAAFHSEIARVPMASRENTGKSPLNSDYGEKSLLVESIPTHCNGERLYILNTHGFMYVHKKTRFGNMCQTVSGASCKNNEKILAQKLAWLKTKGG